MEIGFVGLGRMGGGMTHRLLDNGHRVVGFARNQGDRDVLEERGGTGAESLEQLVSLLQERPRVVWSMVPAGTVTDDVVFGAADLLEEDDIVVDGGNTNFRDDQRRAKALAERGIQYVDAGTSGGVWGYDVGYCLMVGGPDPAVDRLAPVLTDLAPPDGWLHCGPVGSGHFVKMIHNGIEYGLMQAYAEGFEILEKSEFELDQAAIAELWGRGSVVRSWLLELLARALRDDAGLERIQGWVDDSGEGRWTVMEAINEAVPAPVIALSLMMRQRSRQDESYAAKINAALRNQFGGHAVKAALVEHAVKGAALAAEAQAGDGEKSEAAQALAEHADKGVRLAEDSVSDGGRS
jgi:6-phosphogluconate dehydrogenase